MKISMLVAALWMSAVCSLSAQDLEMDSVAGAWIYRGVVKVDSVSAGDLFERASQWIAKAYRSANAVIQYSNKEEGKIIAKGTWMEYSMLGMILEHTLTLEVKDGRLRYTFGDFTTLHTGGALGGYREPLKPKSKKGGRSPFAKDSAKMAESLEKALMAGKVEDW